MRLEFSVAQRRAPNDVRKNGRVAYVPVFDSDWINSFANGTITKQRRARKTKINIMFLFLYANALYIARPPVAL